MVEAPEPSIYESTFAKTDKTDAVLVVQGNEMHVNKAVLSYHSDYLKALFNSEEKSMEEYPIEDVKFEDFATVLSLVHGAPIKYTYEQLESLLKIADRFQLPVAKRYMELFVLGQNIKRSKEDALQLADKFKLNDLLRHVLSLYDSTFEISKNGDFLDGLSNETIDQLFERMLVVDGKSQDAVQIMRKPSVDFYEMAIAKSEKTDGILVVDGKKLHVNKTILSHHSDYFHVLFNSEFKEKSMEEIPIEDVNFENFVTLLSFYHLNPIIPTKENSEDILELADRFSLLSTKFYMEPCMIYSGFSSLESIRIAEKYRLESLYQSGFSRLDITFFKNLLIQNSYMELSPETKLKLLNVYLTFRKNPNYKINGRYIYLPDRRTETSDSSKSDNVDAILVVQGKKLHANKAHLIMNTNTIYDSTFAKTDKTDAVLVVQGKEMHVNKAVLSYHSDYLKTLFNLEENSMEEYPIEDVKFEDFATVLSLVHGAPIEYKCQQVESLLEISDRFQLPVAKRHIEMFILAHEFNTKDSREYFLKLADKFKLNDLISHILTFYGSESFFELSINRELLDELSNETIAKLFERVLVVDGLLDQDAVHLLQSRKPSVDVYGADKSEKTDGILVVDGKKLHVNKTVLSHHSDYFHVLFNPGSKKKSMEEIPIEDVNFESFVTLLSFYHLNPIIPTKINAENILKLADRFSLLSTKFYMEPFMNQFDFSSLESIRLGEKYQFDSLYQNGFYRLNRMDIFSGLHVNPSYQELSSDTKRKIFNRYLEFCR